MNKPLSPAVQAVKDHFLANVAISPEHGLAAAFLASMEHILPLPSFKIGQGMTSQEWCDANRVTLDARRKLIDIAAELEAPQCLNASRTSPPARPSAKTRMDLGSIGGEVEA
jgi:hypothetical protein